MALPRYLGAWINEFCLLPSPYIAGTAIVHYDIMTGLRTTAHASTHTNYLVVHQQFSTAETDIKD